MGADGDIDLRVAEQLRRLRADRSVTLAAVAEQTGISSAHLSRLEKGERQPSVGTLMQLARFYGTTVGDLVESVDDEPYHLVRGVDAIPTASREGSFAVLSGPRADILAVQVQIAAGESTIEARHVGEEWLRVIEGPIQLQLDGQTIDLATGDAVHFDSSKPHRLIAPAGTSGEVLVVSAGARAPAHHPLPRGVHR